MVAHSKNLEKLLCSTLNEISPQRMINTLYEKVNWLAETHLILHDIENFIAYIKFVFPPAIIPKILDLDAKFVRYFVHRTYAGYDSYTRQFRVEKIYKYLKNKINEGNEIDNENLELIEEKLKQVGIPSFERLKTRVLIATILKWLQGPLINQLSRELQGYVIYLGTIFGQHVTKEGIFNSKIEKYKISGNDLTLINDKYVYFEIAMMEAIQAIKEAQAKVTAAHSACEQFHVVFESLDNLFYTTHESRLDDISSFGNKIIVSTALIYLQDEVVEKDSEIECLIKLFVALYYQFRDQRFREEISPRIRRSS